MKKILSAWVFCSIGLAMASWAEIPKRTGFNFRTFGSVPVQIGGRVKPFDSFARETILAVTGKSKFEGWDPVELMLSWITHPSEWDAHPMILISRKDVKRQLGLEEGRNRFSPAELLGQSALVDYANSSATAASGLSSQATPIAKTSRPDPRNEELKRVIERVSLYRSVIAGQAWQVIPAAGETPWLSLRGSEEADIAALPKSKVREGYMEVFQSYLNDRDEPSAREERFQRASKAAREIVTTEVSGWDSGSERKISLELFYNRVHPFQWAWIFYLIASLIWGASFWLKQTQSRPKLEKIALGITTLGFVTHIFGIIIRCFISGRPPVTNMYESVIWVSLGVLIFSYVIWYFQRNKMLFAVSSVLGTIGLIVADAAPVVMDPNIHPLVPVLRSNLWLTIHVLTITISYAALALTMGISNVTLFHYLRDGESTEESRLKISTLNQLSYRAMQFGIVLLAAGTILGGVWADYSWGRFWGWDPKEVWALIALLGYLAIAHARYTGWMKSFGFAAWTVVAFSLVVMAWYGVNFVLGVGLHSYGFSSGGQSTVAIFVLIQMAYVGAVAIRRRQKKSAKV